MLVRLWQTSFEESQKAKLVDYANRVSLPVLASRSGNRGVLFFSSSDRWTTLTLWDDQASIERLEQDPDYALIVEGILALGVLGDDQTTELSRFEGGTLPP